MGKIKKLLESELVGGTQSTDVYPVTSIKAVYDEENERLDNIINRRGIVNISTNYNDDHIAEVLTFSQAINKVPSKDRVLGFQGKFLSENGWESYIFTGESISDWTNGSKWTKYYTRKEIDLSQQEQDTKLTELKSEIGHYIQSGTISKQVNNLMPVDIKKGELVTIKINSSVVPFTLTGFSDGIAATLISNINEPNFEIETKFTGDITYLGLASENLTYPLDYTIEAEKGLYKEVYKRTDNVILFPKKGFELNSYFSDSAGEDRIWCVEPNTFGCTNEICGIVIDAGPGESNTLTVVKVREGSPSVDIKSIDISFRGLYTVYFDSPVPLSEGEFIGVKCSDIKIGYKLDNEDYSFSEFTTLGEKRATFNKGTLNIAFLEKKNVVAEKLYNISEFENNKMPYLLVYKYDTLYMNNGTTFTDGNWQTTDFIEIPETTRMIYAKGYGFGSSGDSKNIPFITFFNSDKQIIPNVFNGKTYAGVNEYSINPQEIGAKYFKCQTQTGKAGGIDHSSSGLVKTNDSQYYILKQWFEEYSSELLKGNVNLEDAIYQKNSGYVKSDGSFQMEDTNWFYSNYIEISSGTKIQAKLFGYHDGTTIISIAFFNERKEFISGKGVKKGINSIEIISPENSKYLVISSASETHPGLGDDKAVEGDIYFTDVSLIIKALQVKDGVVSSNIDLLDPPLIYTTYNDAGGIKPPLQRNYLAKIQLDHLLNGLTKEYNIRFSNGKDNIILYSNVYASNPNYSTAEPVALNGQNKQEISIDEKIISDDLILKDISIKHRAVKNSATSNVVPRILCIGDSITASEETERYINGKWYHFTYHDICKEMYMKDKIDNGNTGFDIIFIGTNKIERPINYKEQPLIVKSYHEGYGGSAASSWLTGGIGKFKKGDENVFSLKSYIDKYRTMDDNGNRLYFGTNKETTGVAGDNIGYLEDGRNSGYKIGTLVTNTEDYDVCTPTHVSINLGTNGGATKSQFDQFISLIKEEYPDMIIGLSIFDSGGTFFPSLHPEYDNGFAVWNQTINNPSLGISANATRHSTQYEVQKTLNENYLNRESENIYVVPMFYCTPSVESVTYRPLLEPYADINETIEHRAQYAWGAPYHINAFAHACCAYQLYSWIKWTLVE